MPESDARSVDADMIENVPLVECTYLVFTRMPAESYIRSGSCDVFGVLINSFN